MSIPENWWTCDHPEGSIVLLSQEATGEKFYACSSCGLAQGEHDLDRETVIDRVRDRRNRKE